ncbi:MAG TPA: SpaA isopeptide-forming pilin-related protein [Pseudonocardiaceae bacterium]|nr:SpaA isopeptide-forming pilin-related protein [Pseudonocardiaceae bacterium]
MLAHRTRLTGALAAACLIGGVVAVAAPAAADPISGYECVVDTPTQGANPALQPLRVCASFDRAKYAAGDDVKLTVSATNLGTATAPGVAIYEPDKTGSDEFTAQPAGTLMVLRGGTDLPPGHTLISEIDGYADDPASGAVTYSAPVYQTPTNLTATTFGPNVSISSAVTPETGNYSGSVFADGNGNGRPDPGEGIAGAQIALYGPYGGVDGNPAQTYIATTGADGSFQLTGLPAGQYEAYDNSAPAGWYVQSVNTGEVMVRHTGGSGPGRFLATPTPIPLTGTMSFDQTSYHAGDTAHVTVTLTNTSAKPIYHVIAACGMDDVTDMYGTGNGWDKLTATNAPGITVPADKTVTLHLSEIVPAGEFPSSDGTYDALCEFAPFPPFQPSSAPLLRASATLLAPTVSTTSFVVNLVDDNPQGGQSKALVQFIDPASKDVVGGGAYGASSGATVTVRPGTDKIELGTPTQGWKLAPGQPATIDTSTLTPGQTVDIHVVPTEPLTPPAPPAS